MNCEHNYCSLASSASFFGLVPHRRPDPHTSLEDLEYDAVKLKRASVFLFVFV